MEYSIKVVNAVAGICLVIFSGGVYADTAAGNVVLPPVAGFYTNNAQFLRSGQLNSSSYLLAANDGNAAQSQADVTPEAPAVKFEPPLMSERKVHQYLGLGTVLFAGLTMLAAPGESEGAVQTAPRQTSGTTHTRLARTTAALAAATVITGLLFHWNDFHLDDGFSDPDNQHVMLAGTGAMLMLYAVNKSAKSSVPTSHAGIAELGAALMLVGIKLTW